MAISYVGANGTAYDETFGNTLAITTTRTISVGEQPIIAVSAHPAFPLSGNDAVSSISDSAGNSWARIYSAGPSGPIDIWWCSSVTSQISSSGTITITMQTSQGAYRTAICNSYTGLNTSAPLDKTASAYVFGTSPDSGLTATTSQADELVYGVINWENTDTLTAGGSLTVRTQTTTAHRHAVLDQIVSSTGTYKANGTISTSTDTGSVVITLLAAAAAATTKLTPLLGVG